MEDLIKKFNWVFDGIAKAEIIKRENANSELEITINTVTMMIELPHFLGAKSQPKKD